MDKTKLLKKGSSSDAHWVLFLMLPFLAGFYAVWNYRAKWAKNVLWAFIVFYGATFSISKENMQEGNESDIVRYVDEVKGLYKEQMTVKKAVDYFNESGEADFLRITLAIVVSRFSEDLHVLTAVYAFIFGFFLTRNMWYLFDQLKGNMKPAIFLLICSFFLANPFWAINGFRFNTSMHIYAYGLLPFLFEGKKSKLLVSASSILVHFSFLLPVLVMCIYIFARNRMTPYFVFFIVSIFISDINLTEFNSVVEENLPDSYVERSSNYRDADAVNTFRNRDETIGRGGKTINWYAVWYQYALLWTMTAVMILLYVLYKKNIKTNGPLMNMYCFSLLFWGFSNAMTSLPSGGRFLSLASMFALATVIFFLQKFPKQKYLNDLLFFTSPALLLFIIISARIGFYSLGITTFLGNPILILFTDFDLSLNDIIK